MLITVRPVVPARDAALLHTWVTHPRSVYWEMPEATLAEVRTEYERILADPGHDAWLGHVDGVAAFLAETYDPVGSALAGLPELRPGDLGMHVLVAPPAMSGGTVPGFTRHIFRAVLEHCFADPAVRRVVVDPDVRNDKILALNALGGFEVSRTVTLPSKDAALSFCTRDAFARSALVRVPLPAGDDSV